MRRVDHPIEWVGPKSASQECSKADGYATLRGLQFVEEAKKKRARKRIEDCLLPEWKKVIIIACGWRPVAGSLGWNALALDGALGTSAPFLSLSEQRLGERVPSVRGAKLYQLEGFAVRKPARVVYVHIWLDAGTRFIADAI